MADELLVAVSRDGTLRARIARTTDLVRDAARRHEMQPLAAHALARALTAASLFPVSFKDCERVSLQWSGGGPVKTLFVELRAPGRLRGYAKNPDAALWGGDPTARAIGRGLLPGGFLAVLKQANDGTWGQGQVALHSGEIDEDLEAYFDRSEQIPTRVRVAVDQAGGIAMTAAGVLVQTLPGGEPSTLPDEALHERIDPAAPVDALLDLAFGGRPYDVLERVPLELSCPCSRERARGGVMLLGRDELLDMLKTDGRAVVRCEFCAEVFTFDEAELLEMIAVRTGSA